MRASHYVDKIDGFFFGQVDSLAAGSSWVSCPLAMRTT